MFDAVTLHGGRAALVWGYRDVAVLTAWRIAKANGTWTLTATVATADRCQCAMAITRKELHFTAPRDKGRWCWELVDAELGTNHVRATLGQPLQ